jgi:predicted unusual protein kinase regulating ubiquinone biosynthesis (AarF/ABC1/UbiB family)
MLSCLENWSIVLSFFWIFAGETIKYKFGFTDTTRYVHNMIYRGSKHNILLVKFAQSLTKNPKLSSDITDAMELYTHSAPFHNDEIDTTVLSRIKQTYDVKLPDKPFHSGMISVAYLGTIKDQRVVIKLKRKNIANKIREGSENITFIYNILCRVSFCADMLNEILALLQVITQTTEYLVSQCDFEHEINVIRTTQEDINKHSQLNNIVIPTVYNTPDDIKNTEFILMNYIDGVFSSEIVDPVERTQYLKLMIEFGMTMTWFFTYYHTDLHNGNVLCMKENGILKLGIIDFGMVLVINENIRGIINCIIELSVHKTKPFKLISLMFNIQLDESKLSIEQCSRLTDIMHEMARMCFTGQLDESIVFKAVSDVNIVLNKNLILNLDTFLLVLSMAMTNSVMLTLSGGDASLIEANMNRIISEFME